MLMIGLLLMLSGCASTQYGNFTDAPSSYDRKMAADTLHQLVLLYPPATTQFNVQQKINDAYGETLIKLLRDRGYAVLEFTRGKTSSDNSSQNKTLTYIVDQQMINLYRITVMIGDESLTRAYVVQNNLLYPAGLWVHKEQ